MRVCVFGLVLTSVTCSPSFCLLPTTTPHTNNNLTNSVGGFHGRSTRPSRPCRNTRKERLTLLLSFTKITPTTRTRAGRHVASCSSWPPGSVTISARDNSRNGRLAACHQTQHWSSVFLTQVSPPYLAFIVQRWQQQMHWPPSNKG